MLLKRKNRENGQETIFEDIITETFLELLKLQEAQRITSRKNNKKSIPSYFAVKMQNTEDKKIYKATRQNDILSPGRIIILGTNFPTAIIEPRG